MSEVFFITGATGNIGGRLIPELLRDSDCRLILLITGKNDEHARQKKDAALTFWQVNTDDEKKRVDVVRGDMTVAGLGLSPADYQRLAGQVTQIIHCAANLKLNLTLDAARTSILDGTEHMVALAQACQQSGQFKRFHYLSTLEVSGEFCGLFKEDFLSLANHKFLNTYEQAKAEVEEFLRQKHVNENMPLTIYRPSMVVGDSKTGRIRNFQSFYYLLRDMVIAPQTPVLPMSPTFRVELSPVDYIAEFMAAVAKTGQETNGQIYHLTNGGPQQLISLSQFIDFARATVRQLTGRKPAKRFFVSPKILIGLLSFFKLFSFGAARKLIETQLIFLQFYLLDVIFDNQNMRQFARVHHITVPSVEECLPILCQYYFSQKKNDIKQLT